jgi:putative membrane protein insertion efficiency factor
VARPAVALSFDSSSDQREELISFMKQFFLFWIRLYKKILSPFLGVNCRFYPTCSEYLYESVSKYGLARGCWLGLKRLLRCHPFHEGGLDPVP